MGRWAVGLAGLSVSCIALLLLAFALGVDPADSYTDDGAQAAWGLVIWASAVSAVVTGVLAVVRRHDRSALVRTAVVVGLLPALMLISEIALGKF